MAVKTNILVVDHDPYVVEYLKSVLEKSGFQVFSASTANLGLQKAIEKQPKIIVLEVGMPDLDGIELCLQMKSSPELKKSFFIFHTDREEDYTQIAAFKAGADDYIIKPVKPKIFISRINALLRKSMLVELKKNEPTNTGLIIDRERYLVMKNEVSISLPRKEFELLALLVASPRKIFSRNEISNLIWGHEIPTKNRTIDVHIRKIREKIGDRYIKTVKGMGYYYEVV